MKSRRSLRLLVEVDYLQDGSMEWRVMKPDTRKRIPHKKWRRSSYGFVPMGAVPTWDQVLDAKYKLPFGTGLIFDISKRDAAGENSEGKKRGEVTGCSTSSSW